MKELTLGAVLEISVIKCKEHAHKNPYF